MREIRIPGIRRILRLPPSTRRLAREIDEEITFHIQSRAEELERLGLSPEAARHRAEAEYGDVDSSRTELVMIDRRRFGHHRRKELLMSFLDDLRYAARGLTRRPALLVVTVAALTVGIAANAVMFGVVDQLLLRPPGLVATPDGVKRIYYEESSRGRASRERSAQAVTSYPMVTRLRQSVPALSEVAGFYRTTYTLGRGVNAQRVDAQLVSGNFFALLGVRPRLGRAFLPEEDSIPQGKRVAVVSDAFWKRELGEAPDALGRTLYVAGKDFTVIGVAPEGFSGIDRLNVDLWIPISAMAAEGFGDNWHNSLDAWWVQVVGRLAPGATTEQVEAQGTAAFRAMVRDFNERGRDSTGSVVLGSIVGTRTPKGLSAESRISLWLMGVSAIVLLIACANVANLLIARTVQRRREIAVRLALGVSRARLARMLLTETALLASIAAAASLIVAYWAGQLVQRVLLPGIVWSGSVVDTRVLAFTVVVLVLCILLTGIAPALQGLGTSVTDGLKEGARQVAGGRSALRSSLVVVQAALSLVLLIGAGLFVRSLRNVATRDVGIDLDRVLLVTMNLGGAGFTPEDNAEIFRRGEERLRAIPGAERVALVRASVPLRSGNAIGFEIPGREKLPDLPGGGPYFSIVGPEFFPAIGARIVRGRNFTPDESRVPSRTIIINTMIADAFFPGVDPIGQCVKANSDSTCSEIVGVVENVMLFSLIKDDRGMWYMPPAHPQVESRLGRALLVRARGDADALVPLVRSELQRLSPNMPYVNVAPFAELVAPQLRPWRLGATMFALFGAIALVIAAVGLYSVMAYWVSQRTHEIGVRMALGAQRSHVVRMVAFQSARAVVLGLAIGGLVAYFASRWVAELLYETSPRDPLIYGIAALVLGLAAAVASVAPVRRSTSVDPANALRSDY